MGPVRPARAGDEAAIDAFLARHAETSMFLRANLASHGLSGGDHPHATTYHLAPVSGPVRAVFGRTRNGFVMCQAPEADAPFAAYAKATAGETVEGITGAADQVERLIPAFGLGQAAFRLKHAEPLMRLSLSGDLASEDVIRSPSGRDIGLLEGWFLQYMQETGLAAEGESARAEARDRAARAISGGAMRLLLVDQAPVAMAAISARAGDMVQVGGVFVPRLLRNRGLGRRVTAALLDEARAAGAQTAILFANNDAAERAYAAIGFARIGWYRVAVLDGSARIGGSA
ncbi:GNAT family N-acetyltransferase [Aliigemmobacter aestuarii]|uniref:GNAT family N-acetyltransferase n=1 Tax=Aliigemmobacter aestuarii TaxID=1445661 RepID=A0A4S3MRJ8_9RHOB|nr:GNAT family N-acetyltransferase [Gemmobacter aestuarii]THD85129.1 GNAT family N-acetyltransferase [Gemmobacter aestuarii]